jgi:hypothetical protein
MSSWIGSCMISDWIIFDSLSNLVTVSNLETTNFENYAPLITPLVDPEGLEC